EALASLERAAALGLRGFEASFTRGKALLLLNRVAEAEQAFAEAVTLRPQHADAQLNLARLRYMRGDADFARTLAAAAAASPADVMLQALLARVLVGAGRYESAEPGLRAAMQRNGPAPE